MPNRADQFISIVIPAKNSSETIALCLKSIFANIPIGMFEVIVVDNGSTDHTVKIANEFNVKTIVKPDVFVSEVRNIGAKCAKGPIVAFVDSDCLITSDWYPALLEIIHDHDIGVTGSKHILPDNPSWSEKVWYEANRPAYKSTSHEVSYIPAGNMIMRLSVFMEAGGFDNTLEAGEDPDLCNRISLLGYKIVEYTKINCVHLGNPKTLFQVFKREKWHGRGVRFKYPNGRISPVVISTLVFCLLIFAAIIGMLLGVTTGASRLMYAIFLPFIIPICYSLRYSKKRGWLSFFPLFFVYIAYYAGRGSAFPTALKRMALKYT